MPKPPRPNHRHSRRPPAELAGKLRAHARRMTGPRRAVLEALRRHSHPVTARELHAALAGPACDPVTVYRCLHVLEQIGLAQRFDFGDGTTRFEAVCGDACAHHHHLICRSCARVVEVEDCFPAALEQRIARGNGFTAITHKLEFFGVCPACQSV